MSDNDISKVKVFMNYWYCVLNMREREKGTVFKIVKYSFWLNHDLGKSIMWQSQTEFVELSEAPGVH